MAGQSSRPFYGEYAWAFDLLIDRPVGQDCAAITAWFSERGVLPGAALLDAGCGTGRYAGELSSLSPGAERPSDRRTRRAPPARGRRPARRRAARASPRRTPPARRR